MELHEYIGWITEQTLQHEAQIKTLKKEAIRLECELTMKVLMLHLESTGMRLADVHSCSRIVVGGGLSRSKARQPSNFKA